MYGTATGNPFVFAGNILGITCSLFYMLSTYGYADSSTRRRIENVVLPLIFIETVISFLFIMLGPKIGLSILGYLANSIVFVVFASPLSTAAKVIKTKNSASINRPFGVIQVLNCITWTCYAAYIGDIYLLVPNAVGLVLGIIQCFLMLMYPAVQVNKDASLLADQGVA
jgi:solute carrier family 50 protein (sugar transporter)